MTSQIFYIFKPPPRSKILVAPLIMRIFKRVLESLASSLSVLGLEATCPRQLGPWPWPRTFSESLALVPKVVLVIAI